MSPKIRRVTGAALTLALVGGVFSLLIWGKLRLVGGVPRSAYAEPGHAGAQAQLPADPSSPDVKHKPQGEEVSQATPPYDPPAR